jgi:hypothetical protein
MRRLRLSNLALLSIESDMVKYVDFDEVMDMLAALKIRRKKF